MLKVCPPKITISVSLIGATEGSSRGMKIFRGAVSSSQQAVDFGKSEASEIDSIKFTPILLQI